MKPLALQLYSVREQLAQDYEGTIRKIADMGYTGVETARAFGQSAEWAAGLFKELGLKVVSAHGDLPVGDKLSQVVDTMGVLGCDLVICPYYDPEQFKTVDGIKKLCDLLNEADANARQNGLRVAYHNHDFEYMPLADGSMPMDHMLGFLSPTVLFEIDTYWVQTAGQAPLELIKSLGDRMVMVHLKDGPAKRGEPMTALGEGVMNVPALIKASTNSEAYIVELDACATEMLEAVDKSLAFVTSVLS